MRIIKIYPLEGPHDNQDSNLTRLPDGWAIIQKDLETANFPFGTVEVEEINGIMTVTNWEPGEMPNPEPEPATEYVTYAELAAAIREGVNAVE